MNIRTHSVKAVVKSKSEAADEGTLAEQQAKLNERMLAKNKLIEEQNKKIEEENRKNKEDNCRIARMNQQSAESARVANRDDLIKRYQGDVAKYCN
jgi:signal peptide, YSIRK family